MLPELVITSIERTGSNVTISWNGTPGRSYTVQWSTNMADWIDIPVGETDTWTDYDVLETNKFYKVHD